MSLDEIEEQASSTPVIPQIRSAESPGFVTAALHAELADTSELTVESIVRLLTLVRADLAAELDHDATPEELLDHVVHVATRLVPGADDAGIALVTDTGLQTCAAAGDAAVAADDIQRALGEGPSQQVITDGQTLRIADLLTEPRWADFGAQVAQLGVRAVLACPLPMPRKRAGVLSLYSARPGAFDAAAELVVPVFAARAAIAAAYADKVTNLHRAIESRQVIGQATGILMERHRLSPKQAFDTMVAASQESHLKLREVALRINETGEEPKSAAAADR
jgi:GAF domain-containing protein